VGGVKCLFSLVLYPDWCASVLFQTTSVPETLDFNELTRLSAREEFINFSRRESFTSYLNTYATYRLPADTLKNRKLASMFNGAITDSSPSVFFKC
jgi:hypothetical protein